MIVVVSMDVLLTEIPLYEIRLSALTAVRCSLPRFLTILMRERETIRRRRRQLKFQSWLVKMQAHAVQRILIPEARRFETESALGRQMRMYKIKSSFHK